MKQLTNTVVHLPTQEDYDEYMKMCEEAGWKWRSGDKPTKKNCQYWNTYHDMTCVFAEDEMKYASKSWYGKKGYKIITLKQLKDMNKTLENLEVGDLVKDEDGYFRKVLGVITPNNGELTTYAMSYLDKNKEHEDLKKADGIWTAYVLKLAAYTPYTESKEIPEYTMEEAIEKIGHVFKIKK